jgi:hypothetical protein
MKRQLEITKIGIEFPFPSDCVVYFLVFCKDVIRIQFVHIN